MPRERRSRYVDARDGRPARNQGVWAQDKLRFIEEYLPPALVATKRKLGHTHFVDLFSGPGRNACVGQDGTVVDFPGSPIVAMRARAQLREPDRNVRFGHFWFCNLDEEDHRLLAERVEEERGGLRNPEVKPESVRVLRGDSNELVRDILRQIPDYAYILVFADIEGPRDLPFATIARLKEIHRSRISGPAGRGANGNDQRRAAL